MPQVTVSSGWTRPDNYFHQDDGAYDVMLKGIGATDDSGEFIPGGTYEHNGQYGLKVKQSWVFQLDNGEIIEAGVTAPKNGRIHPNSTYYAYAAALVGRAPGPGVSFDTDALIGLRAKAFIRRDDNDIPRITDLAPLKSQPQAAAPVQQAPAPAPLREQVAPEQKLDSLPF